MSVQTSAVDSAVRELRARQLLSDLHGKGCMGVVDPKTGRLCFMPRDNLTVDDQAAVSELTEELKHLLQSRDDCELTVLPDQIRQYYGTLSPLKKQGLLMYGRMWVKAKGGSLPDALCVLARIWQEEQAREAGAEASEGPRPARRA